MDSAVHLIRQCGKGALLAKLDLATAYHNVPVHPATSWNEVEGGGCYCTVGLRSAPISSTRLQMPCCG